MLRMDDISIYGALIEKIISHILKKMIFKKYGIKPETLIVSDLDIRIADTTKAIGSISIILNEEETKKMKQKILDLEVLK